MTTVDELRFVCSSREKNAKIAGAASFLLNRVMSERPDDTVVEVRQAENAPTGESDKYDDAGTDHATQFYTSLGFNSLEEAGKYVYLKTGPETYERIWSALKARIAKSTFGSKFVSGQLTEKVMTEDMRSAAPFACKITQSKQEELGMITLYEVETTGGKGIIAKSEGKDSKFATLFLKLLRGNKPKGATNHLSPHSACGNVYGDTENDRRASAAKFTKNARVVIMTRTVNVKEGGYEENVSAAVIYKTDAPPEKSYPYYTGMKNPARVTSPVREGIWNAVEYRDALKTNSGKNTEKPKETEKGAALAPVRKGPRPEKKKKSKTSRSRKADLIFPVGRVHRKLKLGRYASRIGASAPVFLAAALEYLTGEVLELACEAADRHKKKRIVPRHILLAVRDDEDISKLLGNVTIPHGGVLPHGYRSNDVRR
tara:strand:- start:1920 stop:3203 length:1284 start_codon:yes stop_codon:yes gene_type:complete